MTRARGGTKDKMRGRSKKRSSGEKKNVKEQHVFPPLLHPLWLCNAMYAVKAEGQTVHSRRDLKLTLSTLPYHKPFLFLGFFCFCFFQSCNCSGPHSSFMCFGVTLWIGSFFLILCQIPDLQFKHTHTWPAADVTLAHDGILNLGPQTLPPVKHQPVPKCLLPALRRSPYRMHFVQNKKTL